MSETDGCTVTETVLGSLELDGCLDVELGGNGPFGTGIVGTLEATWEGKGVVAVGIALGVVEGRSRVSTETVGLEVTMGAEEGRPVGWPVGFVVGFLVGSLEAKVGLLLGNAVERLGVIEGETVGISVT